jgi:hypothetical protein
MGDLDLISVLAVRREARCLSDTDWRAGCSAVYSESL